MNKNPEEKEVLDLNRNRIKSVLLEAYKICGEQLGTSFTISAEEFASKANIYLDSNRVTIPVLIDLPSLRYPGIKIELNLRRQKVFARMPYRKKQARLNHYLKVL